MKSFKTIRLFTVLLLLGAGLHAQSFKLNNEKSTLEIFGTSNIHDWTIEAENGQGTLVTHFNNGVLESIDQLEFIAPAEKLMSGKSGMDKNTYKALKTDTYKNITFKLKKVHSIEEAGERVYRVKTTGALSIAGVTKDIPLNFNLDYNNEKPVLTGEHSLKMTSYGVDPPTAMFGSIKTGDMVKIQFNIQFNK